MSEQNQTFEVSLEELEKIVRRLEDGDLPLDESLELFEKGVRLSRECRERLNQAERKIEVLLRDEDGNAALHEIGAEALQSEKSENKRIVFEEDGDEDDSPF
jgi:exodeoxyribonuclease VII small subunit